MGNQLAQTGDDNNPQPRAITYDIALENGQQCGILLTIIEKLESYLIPNNAEPGVTIREIDREVQTSAAATFIRTCNRLDMILDSEQRWTDDARRQAIKVIGEMYVAQKEALTSQKEASELQKIAYNAARQPSMMLQATLYPLPNGGFVAGHGNPALPEGFFYAVGKTPAEAFANFDKEFRETKRQTLIESDSAKQPPEQLAAGSAAPPEMDTVKPKRKKSK